MKQLTKKEYQKFLNEIGHCLPAKNFIIGGKYRKGKYGDMLRKYDPIAFEVGYKEEAKGKHGIQ